MASKKLHPYFQAHQVNVLTDVPLRAILHRPELSGRLIKWVVELSEFSLRSLITKKTSPYDFYREVAWSCRFLWPEGSGVVDSLCWCSVPRHKCRDRTCPAIPHRKMFGSSNLVGLPHLKQWGWVWSSACCHGVGECWVEELPGVLWAYQTTWWCPIGKTHFSLDYGMEAVIPIEIGMITLRTT